ncbi:MAG: tetratricopeptide repeat protein [Flavobacteriales bacterium]|nr:tetratricopeptide repeat protein [Flavobacteriales bacterium]
MNKYLFKSLDNKIYVMNSQLQPLFQQAIQAFQSGNFIKAEEVLQYFLNIKPTELDALHLLAIVYASQNKHDAAINYYKRASELNSGDPSILNNWGSSLNAIDQHVEAILVFKKALEIDPLAPEFHYNLANTLCDLKRYEEALSFYEQSIQLDPYCFQAHHNYGKALYDLKRFSEALIYYDRALLINPVFLDCLTNKGVALNELKRYDEALVHFDQALSLKPDYAEAWSNKGVTLNELKRHDEALVHFDQALSLKPDYAEAWLNKAVVDLFLKKYQTGWKNYDWRLKTKGFQFNRQFENLKLWDGSECKNLLITNEQGIGDIIFYASLFKDVKDTVINVTISTDVKLISILLRSFPEITFLDKNLSIDASLYDAQIALGSLPVVMNMNPNMASRKTAYLFDNEVTTKKIKNNLNSKKLLKCGVAWKSYNQNIGKNKSIQLSDLNDIFQVSGYEFINLQYGDTHQELKDYKQNYGLELTTIKGVDLFNDIDGLLSIIQACDLIVTTSNVNAHLAGALGKKTLLLVPYSAGRIWYWHEEEKSSWYPNITIYSQDQNFEWNSAIEKVVRQLKRQFPVK